MSGGFEAAQKNASGTQKPPESFFRLDLPPAFSRPRIEVARKGGDNRRRSVGAERGEKQILGGSDPTLSGLAAAQRLSAPGVATAQVVQKISSLRRLQNCTRNTQ